MKRLITIIFMVILTLSGYAQGETKAWEMKERLGRGINMGNMFEAPTETEWGNPWKPEYFRIIAELGFTHVRLPVRWETTARSSSNPPYTVSATFMNRIKLVVDSALANNLHIVFNMHHHEALFTNPAGQKDRFMAQWRQISEFFKDYPDSLLFEPLNEPNGNLTPELWNVFFPEVLSVIRETNPDRTVLIGTPEWGGLGGLPKLVIPDDDNIILTIHYYNPFNFTHQGAEWSGEQSQAWLGTKWFDTEADRAVIHNEFQLAKNISEEHNIPIHVGEFGAYSKADMESRARWTTYLARWFESQGFSWAYWEFSAGFGIYNPSTKKLVDPLVNALLYNPIPEPARVVATSVYSSNFNTNTDGWSLNRSGGATGSLTRSNGRLNVQVTNGGTEGWHAQLVKTGIRLEKGKTYRVSFKANAPVARSMTAYTGKNSDPWNAYSGYNNMYVTTEEGSFSYQFTMTADDFAARIVFDLGGVSSGFNIWDIKLESIVITPTSSDQIRGSLLKTYPNPFDREIFIDNPGQYRQAALYNASGSKIKDFDLMQGMNQLQVAGLQPGLYILNVTGDGPAENIKLMRR
ncbi:por secretion system C-terminal sorting domain [Bacteroidales bacterium 6E]|nr:por secretion system C-terminal sorting domain [Bacteroidales bacterium 6E]